MIKVPARNKFSRKTSIPFKPDNSNPLRKKSRNRSSILINGQSYQEYFQFLQEQKINQTHRNTKQTILNESIHHSNAKYPVSLEQKYIHKKTFSIKPQQKFLPSNNKSEIYSRKFNKIDNTNTNIIKIQENAQRTSQKNMRRSGYSNLKQSLRSSAMKKIPKFETPFSRSSNMKKASIFHHTHSLTIAHQSEQYEEFLKESNLNELTKKIICQKITESDEEKQNKEYVEKKSNFLIEDKRSQKSNRSKRNSNAEKESRNPKKLLKKISLNTRKSSEKELKGSKDEQMSYNQIFQSMTQTIIEQESDKESEVQYESQLENSSKSQNEQQLALRKEEQLKRSQQKRIQYQILYKQQTEELFRQLQRQIASKQQMQMFEKKSNNYYEEFRLKLLQKYEKIWKDYRMDEKQRDNIGLLIDGCNLQRHRRVNNFYFQMNKSGGGGRIDVEAIGQTTKDINRLNFVNKERNKTIMRPQTSRPKSSSKIRPKLSHEKTSNMLSDYIMNTTGFQTERDFNNKTNRTYNKFSDSDSQYIFNLTNPDIKSRANLKLSLTQRPNTASTRERRNSRAPQLLGRQKQCIKKQKVALANKFDALMGICDEQNDEHEDTNKKMKVFEYYCSKIDGGFEKLSQRITDYVAKL